MTGSSRWLVPVALALLLAAVWLALAGSDSEGSGSSEREDSIADFVVGEDFGRGLGTPDAAECVAISDSQFECEVQFGSRTLGILATVQEDGRTVDLGLTREQESICRAVVRDARHMIRLARAPSAAGQRLSAYAQSGNRDPTQLQRLFAESADAFNTYISGLKAFQPRSEWAREAKPELVAASERGEQALRAFARGGNPAAGRALQEVSDIFDEQIAKAPCPVAD